MHKKILIKTSTILFSSILLTFPFVIFASTYGTGKYDSGLYSQSSPIIIPPVKSRSGSGGGSVAHPVITVVPPIVNTNAPTSPLTAIKFVRILRLGMTGTDIKNFQVYLNTHGYIISESGPGSLNHETNYFGQKTKQAVMLLQKKNKLGVDGIAGVKTFAIISTLK